MWIMIAGPYRSGGGGPEEHASRLGAMNRAAAAMFDKGHVPVIGVNMALPVIEAAGNQRYEEIMMPLSLALAQRCDAVLRMPGESAGADEEMETIRARGGAVYRDLDDIPAA